MKNFLYYIIFFLTFLGSVPVFPQNANNYNEFIAAMSFEQSGYYDKALSLYKKIYFNEPENIQYFEAVLRVALQLKEYDSALEIVNIRLKNHPEDINSYGLLGKIYFIKGDEKKAYEYWDKGAEVFPDNTMSYRIMGNYAMERRAFLKAVDLLQKGKNISTNKFIYSYDLTNIYFLTMRFSDAAKELLFMLKNDEGQLGTVFSLISQNLSKNGAAAEIVSYFEENTFNSLSYSRLMLWLYKETKSFEKALNTAKDLDKKDNTNGNNLFELGIYFFDNKLYSESEKIFNYLLKEFPSFQQNNYSKLYLIKAKEIEIYSSDINDIASFKPLSPERKNKIFNLVSLYDELINNYSGSQLALECQFRKGSLLFVSGLYSEAKSALQKVISLNYKNPYYTAAVEKLARIDLIEDNISSAEQNYLRIVNDKNFSEEERNNAFYYLSKIYFYKKDFSLSAEILKNVLVNLKDNMANDALELSMLLSTKMSDSVSLNYFADADLLFEQMKYTDAAQKFKLITNEKQGLLIYNLAQLKLAEIELAFDNPANSISLLVKIFEKSGNSIFADKALFMAAKIYESGLNDLAKAKEYYEKLIIDFPESIYLDDARNGISRIKERIK